MIFRPALTSASPRIIPNIIHAYAAQLAAQLDPHLQPGDRLLDAGAGELTNLSHMVAALKTPLSGVVACDISEQRLALGRAYAEKHMGAVDLTVFRAEISSLPLPDKGVDVVTTNHALEPNGGRERELLAELLRVARRTLVLFEPCFEIATREGQERMADHGYIRDLARHAEAIGARVESVTPVELVDNRLNPTACFVISH